jgi:hypothetical protein
VITVYRCQIEMGYPDLKQQHARSNFATARSNSKTFEIAGAPQDPPFPAQNLGLLKIDGKEFPPVCRCGPSGKPGLMTDARRMLREAHSDHAVTHSFLSFGSLKLDKHCSWLPQLVSW